MQRFLMLSIAVVLGSGCGDAPTRPLDEQPAPAAPDGTWLGQSAGALPLPAAVLLFDPFEEDGQTKSIHFVADSSRLVLLPGGAYEHRVWFSEWEGAAGGSPARLRYRWFHGDHGSWTLRGSALRLESGWIQNHAMSGTFDANGALTLQHGLGTDEDTFAFRYRRQP